VVLETVGDQYGMPARIAGILWVGDTTAGDSAQLRCPQTNALLWEARAFDTNTFLGAMVPPEGIHAPYGFEVSVLAAGKLLVYLKEG
jgi:hypothetical protein